MATGIRELESMQVASVDGLNDLLRQLRDREQVGVRDFADKSEATYQAELSFHLAGVGVKEAKQWERALKAAKEKRYGLCEDCGNTIPAARLKAVPNATLCLKCKEDREGSAI